VAFSLTPATTSESIDSELHLPYFAILLGAIPFEGAEHTPANMTSMLQELLEECAIPKESIVGLVRDNSSAMISFGRLVQLDS
jgi:hypothetical protein